MVNRDEAKARHAADVYGFTPAPLDGLATAIRKARVLIVATGAQGHTVTPDMIRADQILLVLDMSMPRNVDPAVADHPNVVLVDVDEMSQHALRQLNARKHHFPHAERIVEEELQEFQAWVDASKVAPLLGAVTQTLRNYRDVELGKLKAEGGKTRAVGATLRQAHPKSHHPGGHVFEDQKRQGGGRHGGVWPSFTLQFLTWPT